jgi:hypothetical protein
LLRTHKASVPGPQEKQGRPFIFSVAVSSVDASDRASYLILEHLRQIGYATRRDGGTNFWVYAINAGVEGYGGERPTYNIVVHPSKATCQFQSVSGVTQTETNGIVEGLYSCSNRATALFNAMRSTALQSGEAPCPSNAYRPPDPLNTYDNCAVTANFDTSPWTETYKFAVREWDTGWRLE